MPQKVISVTLQHGDHLEFQHPLHVIISLETYKKYVLPAAADKAVETLEKCFIGVLYPDIYSPIENTFLTVHVVELEDIKREESDAIPLYVTRTFCDHYDFNSNAIIYSFRKVTCVPLSRVIFCTNSDETYDYVNSKQWHKDFLLAVAQSRCLCRMRDPLLVPSKYFPPGNAKLLLNLQAILCEPVEQGLLAFDTVVLLTKLNNGIQYFPSACIDNDSERTKEDEIKMVQAEGALDAILPSFNLTLTFVIVPRLSRLFYAELAKLDIFDELNTIFVKEDCLKNFAAGSGEWVKVEIDTHDSHGSVGMNYSRHALLCALPCGAKKNFSDDDVVLASPQLWYNLNQHPSCLLHQGCKLSIEACPTAPPYAKEIHVTLVQSPDCDGIVDCQSLLTNYFKIPRYVCKGDVICISSEDDVEFQLKNPSIYNLCWPIVYFKVTMIEGGGVLVGYLCDQEHTRLYQVGTSQCYIPVTMQCFLSHTSHLPFFESPCPGGLQTYIDAMQDIIHPILQVRKFDVASNILITGSSGCGKTVIIRATCRCLNLHLYEVNCRELIGDTSATIETKLRIKLDRASPYAPCLVVLKNIDYIGKEKELKGENSRVLSNFIELLKEVNALEREWPLIIVATTTRINLISAELAAFFLHHIDLEIPSETERIEMIESLLEPFTLGNDLSFNYIGQRTAGFVLKDFIALVHEATKMQYSRVTSLVGKCCNSFSEEDMQIARVPLTQQDMLQALDKLQSDSNAASGGAKIPNVHWEDVGGLSHVKQEILDTIQLPLEHPEILLTGLRRSGVLLYGPPGTGKTLLAKAVATECSLNFMSVKGPELINMYVGQSEQNVRTVFHQARSAVPCIVFFDELDSLAPNRGRSGDSGGVMDRVVSQLLAELDGLGNSTQVYVIGATNRIELLDPALLRPGRFDRLVYVGIPEDTESKLSILKALTRKIPLADDVNLEEIVQKCPPNISGADFYSLCSDATMHRVETNVKLIENGNITVEASDRIQQEDFTEALKNLVPSVSIAEMYRYQQQR